MIHDLILIIASAALALIVHQYLISRRAAEQTERLYRAHAVLTAHGLTPCRYLASMGMTDRELREACDEYASIGYLIVDAQGKIVGVVAPPRHRKRTHLRLVVNSKEGA